MIGNSVACFKAGKLSKTYRTKLHHITHASTEETVFVCCLLCCAIKVSAQYSIGNTGLLNIPTADMQETGTFMGGGNYLPNGMTPFNFNTGNYFINITFLSILEMSYRCTLLKTTRYDGKKDISSKTVQ